MIALLFIHSAGFIFLYIRLFLSLHFFYRTIILFMYEHIAICTSSWMPAAFHSLCICMLHDDNRVELNVVQTSARSLALNASLITMNAHSCY